MVIICRNKARRFKKDVRPNIDYHVTPSEPDSVYSLQVVTVFVSVERVSYSCSVSMDPATNRSKCLTIQLARLGSHRVHATWIAAHQSAHASLGTCKHALIAHASLTKRMKRMKRTKRRMRVKWRARKHDH